MVLAFLVKYVGKMDLELTNGFVSNFLPSYGNFFLPSVDSTRISLQHRAISECFFLSGFSALVV